MTAPAKHKNRTVSSFIRILVVVTAVSASIRWILKGSLLMGGPAAVRKYYDADSLPSNPYSNVSVSMIALASAQRSSSTSFTTGLAAHMDCHVSLNEVLNPLLPGQKESWHEREGKLLDISRFKIPQIDPALMAHFIIRVTQRMCHDLLTTKHPEMAERCHNHCYGNYKHFPQQMAEWQHEKLWDAFQTQLYGQVQQPLSFAILERPVEQRWRSWWYATHKADWNTHGSKEHKEKVAQAKIPKISKAFQHEHEHWFETVRHYIHKTNQHLHLSNRPPIPFMEITFDEFTNQPIQTTLDRFRQAVMKEKKNEEANNNNDKE